MIVLEEGIPMRQGPWGTDDYFVIKTQLQRRVLRLNEQGVYEVSVWVQVPGSLGGTAATFAPTQVWVPLRLGEPLTFIPFVTMTPLSLRIDVVQSLMEPLVEIAFRYFRHSADYEHALHLTSLPTPWIAGDLDPLTELLIGSLTAWVLPQGRKPACWSTRVRACSRMSMLCSKTCTTWLLAGQVSWRSRRSCPKR